MTFEQYLIAKKITDLSPHIKALMLKAWEAATGAEASKYKPISAEERLPLAIRVYAPWSEDVIVYTAYNKNFVACYDYKLKEWYDNGELVRGVTHWLPIPRLPI